MKKNVDTVIKDCRKRLVKMHYEAGVGHLGGNLSCIDFMAVLLSNFYKENDRFVLSKGHSAGALYVGLWSINKISDEYLATFHKSPTKLGGHPPVNTFPDIPFATGSLGHGLSLAAGLALSKKLKNDEGHVYCLTSDGEWQEGSTWEAFIFALHQKLDNLTIIIDKNNLQGFGTTKDVASMDDLEKKLSGFIHPIVINGHAPDEINTAISQKTKTLKLIIMNTIKGNGIESFQNTMRSHYDPINKDDYEQMLRCLDA
jgi:transketolase